jgi:uncharacterized protein (DUF1330 family)
MHEGSNRSGFRASVEELFGRPIGGIRLARRIASTIPTGIWEVAFVVLLAVALRGAAPFSGAAKEPLPARTEPVAQGKSPGAYAVVDVSEISDPEAFNLLLLETAPVVASAGGHYIVLTDKIVPLDGGAPKRLLVIAFDSIDKGKAWYNSAAQQKLNALGGGAIKGRTFVAEGVSN